MLAADHHGTSSIATDTTTYAVTKRYSTPFGAPRGTKATNCSDARHSWARRTTTRPA
ncbi:hypothetical protein [Streptomyces avermitilis]|uniref:hypothetical protein n=1 Tax=Streptomyces avermitilis TaxID=33903 RepID=UPI003F541DAF